MNQAITSDTAVDIRSEIAAFQELVQRAISTCSNASSTENYLQELANQNAILVQQLTTMGDHSAAAIAQEQLETPLPYYILYEWMEQAKQFVVLWRDVVFQQQKALLQRQENHINDSHCENLKQTSLALLQKASDSLMKAAEPKTSLHKSIAEWRLQHNPWEVYRTQLQEVPTQCTSLVAQWQEVRGVAENYQFIRQFFTQKLTVFLNIQEELRQKIQDIHTKLSAATDYSPSKVIQELKEAAPTNPASNAVTAFTNELEQQYTLSNETQKVVVETENGVLLYKSINFHKATSLWLESEIMATVYDFFTLQQTLHNQFNLAVLNIKNRIDFEKREEQERTQKAILSVLQNFLQGIQKSKEETESIQQLIMGRLEQELQAGAIYQSIFLDVSMTSTLNQYRRYQLKGWQYFWAWVKHKGLFVKEWQQSVLREDTLSLSEKIVRVVRQRTPQESNKHYTNIFLTKGYIGDSFCVGRTKELQRIGHLIDNWKLGFRGACLIMGKRFSGKTLLGTLISQRHFAQKTIHIGPNSKLRVAGRTLEVEYDLKDALDFIIKYDLQGRSMIWIDDLVDWEHETTNITLSSNIQALLQAIDQYSTRFFFVVSISPLLKKQLNQFFDLDKVFQSEINTDSIDLEAARSAILIRHNATQNKLTTADGMPLNATEVDKIIQPIYKAANGNIGEILQQWAYRIHRLDDEKVHPKTTSIYTLPDFTSIDTAILLRIVLLERHTNEYFLSKKFGTAFRTVYQPILQRLFHLKILKRELDGMFEINPYLVNDIETQLDHTIPLTTDTGSYFTQKSKL